MMQKEFDPIIYPVKLIIMTNADYDYLVDRFTNLTSPVEKWDSKEEVMNMGAFAVLVKDHDDNDIVKELIVFSDETHLDFRNVCHEAFHAAIEIGAFLGMNLGFNVGEDEHYAYLSGWIGNCISEFIACLDLSDNGSEEEKNEQSEIR